MTNSMIVIWLLVAIMFLLGEMGSPGLFYFLSFFFGAVATAGIALFVEPILYQTLFFFGASIIAFCFLRIWVKRDEKYTHKTNVYALQGKQALVVHDIMPDKAGSVKVQGEIWSAHAIDRQTIKAGAYVEVIRVEGAHLIVAEKQY